MSNNTYWGSVPKELNASDVIEPGNYEDNYGTANEQHAIWMGDALIEGTPEAWLELADSLKLAFATVDELAASCEGER